MLIMMSYLIYLIRLVYRVEVGLWFYATVLAIPLLNGCQSISRRVFTVILGSVLAAFAVYFYFMGNFQRTPSRGRLLEISLQETVRNNYQEVFEYMESLPENTIFLMPMWIYQSFSRYREPLYFSAPIGSWKRIVSFGFWTPYFPDIENSLRQYGVENPMRNVVKENVVVLGREDVLLDFLHRHYYKNVRIDTLRSIGLINFFKYSEGELDD